MKAKTKKEVTERKLKYMSRHKENTMHMAIPRIYNLRYVSVALYLRRD